MPEDIAVYIGGRGTGPVIPANAVVDENWPEITVGDEVVFQLAFRPGEGFPDGDGHDLGATYSGATGATYGGALGATSSDTTEYVEGHPDRYEALRDWLKYTDNVAVNRSQEGVAFVREHVPVARLPSERDTLLVPIRPGSGIQSYPGFWVAITGYRDETGPVSPSGQARINLQTTALASLDDYGSRDELRGAIDSTPI